MKAKRQPETCGVQSMPQSLEGVLEEADVRCGLGLQQIYSPCHMEVDGGIRLVSTGPQRAHSSTRGKEWGVACPLPHKWTTQQNTLKGKSCVTLELRGDPLK
ncbi:hypothetical protein CRENBAI_022974 [Crenichthys baileyi]|uniref:Uncharacterized protein n=1 Tax=Crenichthys baileyi TaxID=28760 RepID=A0AAV9RL88_9TELE